jgi:hypothetical protein
MRVTLAALLVSLSLTAAGESIQVDIAAEHVRNIIRPTEALGAGVDRLPYGAADKLFKPATLNKILSAGWQTVSYRQNTELHTEAWHWNPKGHWSGPGERGYFVGEARAADSRIIHSYGYPLPRRGVTRDDGTDNIGYSRLDDGDPSSFWKSNPYLAEHFTGESDARHPQWVIIDLTGKVELNAVRIDWAAPYATDYLVQFWTGEDPIRKPAQGSWQLFPHGEVRDGKGGRDVRLLADRPMSVQFVRILMSRSSNTCVGADSADIRNCLGFAIAELGLGALSVDGEFHDVLRHTKDQDQTPTYCSSVDPWHEARDLDQQAGEQVGFDRFFTSGITRALPAMIPIALIYSTPEDAAAQLSYLESRKYPISYVEMGEEPDGHYGTPEDYAALYLQFAHALHRVDPKLKLGGPIFTGQNEDIQTWADERGKTSWTGRFIDYLRAHHGLGELAFFSFEHYPIDPGKAQWSSLYEEPHWVRHIMEVWREDGVPKEVPLFITESNLSSQHSEAYMDIFGALWLADYIGAFLTGGGDAVYYFHYMPAALSPGHNGSPGTFGFFDTDKDLNPTHPHSQYFASQLINLDWLESGPQAHQLFEATSDVTDGAGHVLVTAYPVKRPDGQFALLIVNKDQDNAHRVRIDFNDPAHGGAQHFAGEVSVSVFGQDQYRWQPSKDAGHADPDGPAQLSHLSAGADTTFTLPAASIVVLRGALSPAP